MDDKYQVTDRQNGPLPILVTEVATGAQVASFRDQGDADAFVAAKLGATEDEAQAAE